MCENGTMRLVEAVLRRLKGGKKNDVRVESN
jgi:hypothetical protein